MASILIVEDDSAYTEAYKRWLSDHDVQSTNTGKSALSLIDSSVDVVLLDRRLPDLSGETVLSEINQRNIDCRVAMITAVEPDFDVAAMGFDAYLVKPVTKQALRSVVERLCQLSTYDAQIQRLHSLAARKSALEQSKSRGELAGNPEYERLMDEFDRVKARVDTTVTELLDEGLGQLIQ